MSEPLPLPYAAVLLGIGASLFIDAWTALRRRLFGIPALDYALVGRWLAHLPRGRFRHASIAAAGTVRGEALLGWTAHYLIGIAFAVARLKPAALVPKAQASASEGFERVLEHKYFVDEGYDKVVVQPLVGVSRAVLWKGMDAGLIDGLLVNGSAQLARGIGWLGSRLQSGQVGTYAWVIIVGVVAVLGAFSLR